MRKLAIPSVVAIGMLCGGAHAGTISESIAFSLSGFVDISGADAPPPDPLITGSFTVTYDPTLGYYDDTTDIVVHSLNGVTVDSTLGFTYGGGLLEFGGIAFGAGYVVGDTNDLVVSFNVTDPTHPTFVPCSTPGYTCGIYTGSDLVDASGYTVVGADTAWFYGAQQSTAGNVPEPASASLLALGLAALVARRVRPVRRTR